VTPASEPVRAGHPIDPSAAASRWLSFAWAAAIVAADRVSKAYIRASITPYDSVSVVPGWFRIVHTENPGAAFGVLADCDPRLRTVLLVGVAVIVLCVVTGALWNRRGALSSSFARFGLSLILGGAVGNLVDRVTRGTVTDFLELYRGGWSFPAFNVADSAITIGSVLLMLDVLCAPRKPTAAPGNLPPPGNPPPQ
jgi:signal peptidase II